MTTTSIYTVPVICQVHHKNKVKFLYHTILCYSQIQCENSIFSDNSFENAFQRSGLCGNISTKETINHLLKTLILEEYCWLPIRARQLAKYIKEAKNSLTRFLINNELETSAPSVSEHMITVEAIS